MEIFFRIEIFQALPLDYPYRMVYGMIHLLIGSIYLTKVTAP